VALAQEGLDLVDGRIHRSAVTAEPMMSSNQV